MKFEDWFYQEKSDEHKSVVDFDLLISDHSLRLEEFLRKAYEAGYKLGVEKIK
jgi:hypothetical protein